MQPYKTPEQDIQYIVLQRLTFADNGYTFLELQEILDNAGFRDTENQLTKAIEQLFKQKKIAFTLFSRNGHKAYVLTGKKND